jgi:hypothetical protein
MTELIEVLKDLDGEHLVPTVWRKTLSCIVDASRRDELSLDCIDDVNPASLNEANRLRRNIAAYGVHLARLPERTWQTSVCRWMDGYWDVLVDLFTEEAGESDLVLFIKVYEQEGSYRFSVESVHVP